MIRPGDAVAEDARRVGVAVIVTGFVASLLEARVAPEVATLAAIFGITLLIVGYWYRSASAHGTNNDPLPSDGHYRSRYGSRHLVGFALGS